MVSVARGRVAYKTVFGCREFNDGLERIEHLEEVAIKSRKGAEGAKQEVSCQKKRIQ